MTTFSIEFAINDIPGLVEHISALEADMERMTEKETRERVEAEFEGRVDISDVIDGRRILFEPSAAIRRGDRAEAEYQLDQLAEEIGVVAVEQVQQARFSNRARVYR